MALHKGGEASEVAILEFEGKKPIIGRGTYVFDSADVIGNVQMGEECYIGPGARVRGDYGQIVIGSRTTIEDNCVIHARPNEKCVIGNDVTVGHLSVVHNCKIEDFVIIGMGATVSDYAEIGEWAVIGEGAVVKNKQKIPGGTVAVGVPAKVVGEIDAKYKEKWTSYKKIYSELARRRYPKGLKRIA